MTDMTLEAPMGHGAVPIRRGAVQDEYAARIAARRREYCAYFAAVFVLALPLSLAVWTMTALRRMALPERGPLRAAWSQAAIITPIILSA